MTLVQAMFSKTENIQGGYSAFKTYKKGNIHIPKSTSISSKMMCCIIVLKKSVSTREVISDGAMVFKLYQLLSCTQSQGKRNKQKTSYDSPPKRTNMY